MANNDSYGFLGSGAPSAKFTSYGDVVGGVITTEPVVVQQTDPKPPNKPLVWDDGSPRMQLVVTVQTELRDPTIQDDDGKRRIFVKGAMRTAVQTAVIAAGAKGIDVGGELYVGYTHDGEKTAAAFDPPKQYEARYVPPKANTGLFLGTGAPAAAPVAVAQPVAQAVAPAVVAAPVAAAPVAAPVASVAPAAPAVDPANPLAGIALTPEVIAALAALQAPAATV